MLAVKIRYQFFGLSSKSVTYDKIDKATSVGDDFHNTNCAFMQYSVALIYAQNRIENVAGNLWFCLETCIFPQNTFILTENALYKHKYDVFRQYYWLSHTNALLPLQNH